MTVHYLPPVPIASHDYLRLAAASLAEAIQAKQPGAQYAAAHVAALRGTAALLAAKARPAKQRRRQKSAWVLLVELAPEFSDWAAFFAAGANKRAAAAAGARNAVTEREAADLIRNVVIYLRLIEDSLGLLADIELPVAL